MSISRPAVNTSGEHELVTIAAELERYWTEQWRRAKEICDLLEHRLASRAAARPRLRLVTDAAHIPESSDSEPTRPLPRAVDP